MGLGLKTESSGGDFLPRIQYDARAGRFFQIDRTQNASGGWETQTSELPVPAMSKFAMDLENIEVGWIKLGQGTPDFRMVPIGSPMPAQPEGRDDKGNPLYRQGFRVKVYTKGLGIRHWNHTAKCVIQAVDALHEAYLAERDGHPGMLPVVQVIKTIPVTTGQGAKQSTNYQPVFEIEQWIDRPEGLRNATQTAQVDQMARDAAQVPPPVDGPAQPTTQPVQPAIAAAGVEF